jgi:SanA protein
LPQTIILLVSRFFKPIYFAILFAGLLVFISPRLFIIFSDRSVDTSSYKTKDFKVAMVLGAGIQNNSYPSYVLSKRLDTAIKLYNDQTIKTILVSGDNSNVNYNEPEVMKNYLTKNSIPEKDIVLDYGGRRTFDSCWRAKNVFKAQNIYVVTQDFHISRSDFLCREVGLNVIPVVAENSVKNETLYSQFREILSSWAAIYEVNTDYKAEIKADGKEADLSQL